MSFRDFINRPLYYRRDGSAYPPGREGILEWTKDFENAEDRRIGFDRLSNGIEVSTVWMGIDHGFLGNRRPLIFETMAFVPQHTKYIFMGGPIEFDRQAFGEPWRYSTEEEAKLGHRMMVEKFSQYKTADDVLKNV